MYHYDSQLENLEKQVLFLTHQLNYLTSFVFSQPDLIPPDRLSNLQTPPCFKGPQIHTQQQRTRIPSPQNQRHSSASHEQIGNYHNLPNQPETPAYLPRSSPENQRRQDNFGHVQDNFEHLPNQPETPAVRPRTVQRPVQREVSPHQADAHDNFSSLPNQPETPGLLPARVQPPQQRRRQSPQQRQNRPPLQEQVTNPPRSPVQQIAPQDPEIIPARVQPPQQRRRQSPQQCQNRLPLREQVTNPPRSPVQQIAPQDPEIIVTSMIAPAWKEQQHKELLQSAAINSISTATDDEKIDRSESEAEAINQFASWPPKEYYEDEELSDKESEENSLVEDRTDAPIAPSTDEISQADEEILQMMSDIASMSSADFINNRDTVMDLDVAKFFLMGEHRRARKERQEQIQRSKDISQIKGKAELVEEEQKKMSELYGEHKENMQARKFAHEAEFKEFAQKNKLQEWPAVPLAV